MNEQIEVIKTKLAQLKALDIDFTLFASETHLYKVNPILSVEKIRVFEATHKIELPDGYVQFLTLVGNGGAGPSYGLEPFENALFDDLDYKRADSLLNPAKPFLHTKHWNLEFSPTVSEEEGDEYAKQYAAFEAEYYAGEEMNGVVAICNHGCAINSYLVVYGLEHGNIWTDDRGSDYGIYPCHGPKKHTRVNFLDWYESWLDDSLLEISQLSVS